MQNQISNVGFGSPGFDYGADLSAIERQRALALQLQNEAGQPVQSMGPPGSHLSWTQGLAKMFQGYQSGAAEKNAEQKQRELAQKAQSDYSQVLARGLSQLRGTPASEMPGSELSPGYQTPAVAPNPEAAMGTFGSHPMGAPFAAMAMKEVQDEQRRKAMASILGGGAPQQAPGSPTANAGPMGGGLGAGQPAAAPSGQGGGFTAGIPPQILALMSSGDQELVGIGKSLLDANKGVPQRAGAPVVNPFTGAVIAQPTPAVPPGVQLNVGPGGPVASAVPGFAGAQSGLHDIPKPDAAMVKLPTSGGQTIELTQPEYLEWQRTRQLPQRFGQQPGTRPPPASGTPEGQAYQQVASGKTPTAYVPEGAPSQAPSGGQGLGTVGLTQSQPDIIRQARETAGGKAVDEQFAKDYVQFTTGGAQDAQKQISQLADVQKSLSSPKAALTGPIRGSLPDAVTKFTNPQAIAMRERVEEVVQRSLRAILGAQFTEKEGERLIARAYNPNLPEKENAIRVNRLTTQLQQAFDQKKSAAEYFQKNNTLEGWQGKLPSMSDFDPEIGKAGTLTDAEDKELADLRKRFGR